MYRAKYEIYDYYLNRDNYDSSKLREYAYIEAETEEELLEKAKELYKKYSLRASLLWQYANNYEDRLSHKQYLVLITGTDKEIEKEFNYLKYSYDASDIFFGKIELISNYKPKIDLSKEICPEEIKNELLEKYSKKLIKGLIKN
jgi:hypothetical protein